MGLIWTVAFIDIHALTPFVNFVPFKFLAWISYTVSGAGEEEGGLHHHCVSERHKSDGRGQRYRNPNC